MKGVVLAGGLGSRLLPLTRVTNKHLLPVYDKPMVFYPLQCLVNAGIDDILLVTGGPHAGDFLKLLGNGKDFGLERLNYAYQEGEGGIADALRLAEPFAKGEPICVILGDNIIEKNIKAGVDAFRANPEGARLFLKKVSDPQRFGVPVLDGDTVTAIVEKPSDPPSDFAVIGIYLYDATVFDFIRQCTPSQRGELEITDVNNHYVNARKCQSSVLDGWWTDAGTFDSLIRASNLVHEGGANGV